MAFNLFDFSNVKPSQWTSDASLNPFASAVGASSSPKTTAPFAPGVEPTYAKPEEPSSALTNDDVDSMDSAIGLSESDVSEMDKAIGNVPEPAKEDGTFASKFKMESSESFAPTELAKDVAKFFVNVPADSVEVVEQLGRAALHPIDTVTGMLKAGQGLSDKAVFSIGNAIVREFGGKDVPPTEEAKMIDAVGERLKQEYGTAGKLKKAAVENPADVLLTVMGGLGVAKDVAQANGLTSTVSKIEKLQSVVNPVNVLKKEAEAVGSVWTGIKKAGEAVYKSAITPTVREAELMQKAEAGLGKAPVTRADTALRTWIAWTETSIGTQALKKADELWNTKIQPYIRKSTATHSADDIFDSVKSKIASENVGALRKKELGEALDALRQDYVATGKKTFSTSDLQVEKSTLDEFTPSKIFKGQDIANSYNQVKNYLANEMRSRVREDLGKFGIDAKASYRDYANLQELSKIGVKAITEKGLRGGFGNFWSTVGDMVLTPVKTIGGKTLYRVGDALEFLWPKGISKFSDFIKGKVKIAPSGELVPQTNDGWLKLNIKRPESVKPANPVSNTKVSISNEVMKSSPYWMKLKLRGSKNERIANPESKTKISLTKVSK